MRDDGTVKILDFGLAKQVLEAVESEAATQSMSMTAAGTLLGTFPYMAPEQFEGAPADRLTDLWSLGVVLYEMLSGHRPFRADSQASLMHAVVSEAPEPLSRGISRLPQELGRIVSKALEKKRSSRHSSAAELGLELTTLHAALTAPEPATGLASLLFAVRKPAVIITSAVSAILIMTMLLWSSRQNADVQWAREVALPEILRLVEQDDKVAAFSLAQEALKVIPQDPILSDLWDQISVLPSITTTPGEVTAYYKPYSSPEAEWTLLGTTPVTDEPVLASVPLRLRFEKEGHETLELATFTMGRQFETDVPTAGTVAPGMVSVPALSLRLPLTGFSTDVQVPAPSFEIDRYEVTNEAFKVFVDSGGYERREFWVHEFVEEGQTLTWAEAIARFRDSTGRPGPSTWRGGTYLEGQARYPVTGVSWYEATAYAAFVEKSLPSIFHWASVSVGGIGLMTSHIIAQSNYSNTGLAPVGTHTGLGPFGTYDMGGNAREWVSNAVGDSTDRYILGGAWNEASYTLSRPDARSPFDRSDGNGFRCVRYGDVAAISDLLAPVDLFRRDFGTERPVSDEIFEVYADGYAYDRTDLNGSVETIDDSSQYWTLERATMDTSYGDERFSVYLFLPKNVEPPYQTMMFFPGGGAMTRRTFDTSGHDWFNYLILSGRAVAVPVYDETFDRNKGRRQIQPDGTASYRNWTVRVVQDFIRAVDYLESRPDIDSDRVGYYGVSWGGRMAPLIMALDSRLKTGVLIVGGLTISQPLPEVDPFHFAPRVSIPVLMLNGDDDVGFPVAASQEPLFALLGTPPNDKRHVVFDSGHGLPFTHANQIIAEVLPWLDRYLGPVD